MRMNLFPKIHLKKKDFTKIANFKGFAGKINEFFLTKFINKAKIDCRNFSHRDQFFADIW